MSKAKENSRVRAGTIGSSAEPEQVYASWRLECSLFDLTRFQALCEEHPEIATTLRGLRRREVVDQRPVQTDSSAGAIEWGEWLPGPLDEEESAVPDRNRLEGAFDELIQRLERRLPSESRYDERGEIGRGGMGAVLEVYDEDLRRSVAKKVVLRDRVSASDPTPLSGPQLARFCEEAQVTAQLAHPGVVSVHELGVDEQGRVFFTMDLVEGKTLDEVFAMARAERGGWNLVRAVGVLERVCETLAFAHSKGVIHRDVKPGNVMVGAFGEVYLLDWGLARLLGCPNPEPEKGADEVSTDRRDATARRSLAALKTEEGVAAGTPGFMPPEQARGDLSELDERSDIYALGAMLYTLLTGTKPFADEVRSGDLLRLIEAMQAGGFTPVDELDPDAPAELVSVAHKAMSSQPARRYRRALDLASDLRAWLEGRVVQAHGGGPWQELRKWVRRNRGLSAALLATFLAVTGGATGMALLEHSGRVGIERERRIGEINGTPVRTLGLLADSETLWPSLPEQAPGLEGWLEDWRELERESATFEGAIAALRGEPSDFDAEELDPRLAARLPGHLDRIQEVASLTPWIQGRLDLAQRVDRQSLESDEARGRWALASREIRASSQYGGLQLDPQRGLLPLREDPESGLWEFWHVLSGEEPSVNMETGRWRITPETGVVLVLIPGGKVQVGSPILQSSDPAYDSYAESVDLERSTPPVHEVDLDPYFISKYELTQAQWARASREEPWAGPHRDPLAPANTISWDGATQIAGRLDLCLPTEAQWEAAARGGRSTRFFSGTDPRTLKGHVVLLPDLDGDYEVDSATSEGQEAVFGERYTDHALSVGDREPNPFGLHDTVGNVYEWCRDRYSATAAPRPGDGERIPEKSTELRVLRGGGFNSSWPNARHGYRFPWGRRNSEPDCGVRLARKVRS